MGIPMILVLAGIALATWIIVGIIKKTPKFMSIWPQSRAGKWSVGLVMCAFIMMILLMIGVNTPYFEPGKFPAHILGTSWIIITVIATIACIKALWKDQECSIIFLLCAFITLIMFIMAAVELVEGIRMLLGLPVG